MNGDSHDADLFRRFLEFQQAQGSASGAGSPQAPTTRGSATSHHPSSAPPASQFATSSPSQGVAGPSTEQSVPGSLFHPLVPASSSTSTHIGRSAPGSSLASAAPSYPGISPPTASTLHPQPTSQSAQSQHMPISQPYPSAHPTTSTGFQPFLGMQNLGIHLATGNANQARLSSAASTLPRPPALTRRRARGPSRHPPTLPRPEKQDVAHCYVDNALVPTVRITVKVYPPSVCEIYICIPRLRILIPPFVALGNPRRLNCLPSLASPFLRNTP